MSVLINPYALGGGSSVLEVGVTTGVRTDSWTTFEGGEGGEGYYVEHFRITKGFVAPGLGDPAALGSASPATFAGKTIAGIYTDDADGNNVFNLILAISGSPLGAEAVSTVRLNGTLVGSLTYYNTGVYEQWYRVAPSGAFVNNGDPATVIING